MRINGWNKSHEISLFMVHTNGWWGVLGPKGVGHRRRSRFRASVLGKRMFLHIFHCPNHRQFVFKLFCFCAVAGMGCMSLPLLCPHLAPKACGGSGAESTALPREPGQELHKLRAPACSCWHPAFSLETLEVFSPNLWLPPWGVYLLGCQRGDTNSIPPQLPHEGWCSLDLKHQLTTCKLVLIIFSRF